MPAALALTQFFSVLVTAEMFVSSTSATELAALFAETLFWGFSSKSMTVYYKPRREHARHQHDFGRELDKKA